MIKLDDLCAVVDSLGIPWANEGFTDDEKPAPPYIVLQAGIGEALYADNIVWMRWTPYDILLYSRQRSYDLESAIAKELDDAGCAYEQAITHVDDEDLIEASFTVNVTE